MGWLRRLFSRNEPNKSPQHPLAAGDDLAKQPWPTSEIASIPVPGEVIEDYEILEKIGGNMGWVFKARHRLLNKVVALKLLPAEWMADSNRLERFEREIRALGQLEHPNLVTAADARRMDSWYFVVMEWIEGLDLHQLVKAHGPLPISAACEAARQAALGLQFAHEHGLIHRDIKPSNLMLSVTGIVKVIDMGLALANEGTSAQLTQTGQVMGTMNYCAPEQFRNASTVDTRADIYSLGCTLYHLIAGKVPYGHRKSITEIVQAHLNEPFPNLREARPDAPGELETLLKRMTEKDPDARFPTPGAVAEALERFATGANLKPFVPTKAGQEPPAQFHPGKTPQPLQKRRRADEPERRLKLPWPRLAASVVALVAILGTAALFLSSRKPVLVLMDTTAARGIYDDDNRRIGRSNAKEVVEALGAPELKELLPQKYMHEVPVDLGWAREEHVIGLRPTLVIIHRSSFYHPWAVELSLPYPPFKTHEEYLEFSKRYEILGDKPLREFLKAVGKAVPQARFLIYSRGTETNWISPSFRQQWAKDLESDDSGMVGRVTTMEIPGGQKGSFRNEDTRFLLRSNVAHSLKLSVKFQPVGPTPSIRTKPRQIPATNEGSAVDPKSTARRQQQGTLGIGFFPVLVGLTGLLGIAHFRKLDQS